MFVLLILIFSSKYAISEQLINFMRRFFLEINLKKIFNLLEL